MNWVSDFNYMVRRFFRRSKRFLELAPVIWKGEDYDSGYAIELFRTQLNRTADFLVNDSYRVDGKVKIIMTDNVDEILKDAPQELLSKVPPILISLTSNTPSLPSS